MPRAAQHTSHAKKRPAPPPEKSTAASSKAPAELASADSVIIRLPRQLADATRDAESPLALRAQLSDIILRVTAAAAAVFYERDADGQLQPAERQVTEDLEPFQEDLPSWSAWCETACRTGTIQMFLSDGRVPVGIVAVPVPVETGKPEAFCVVFDQQRGVGESVLAALQLVATHLTLWHERHGTGSSPAEFDALAAILEIVTSVSADRSLSQIAATIVADVKRQLSADQVVLATIDARKRRASIQAVSGLSHFDPRSPYITAIEAALDEAILHDALTAWPSPAEQAGHQALAHQQLCQAAGAETAISAPLRGGQQQIRGICLCLGTRRRLDRPEVRGFLQAAATPIGSSLDLFQSARRSVLQRLAAGMARQWRARWLTWSLALLIGGGAILCIPWPYKIACDSVVEPVIRRYVAAPFDGRLQKANVEPGDLVRKGDVLAQLDGRELRWELAGLEAEYGRAQKQRDVAMAARNTAEAQLARLEMEQLELKMQLLRHRSGQLDVRSPLDGIVVSGDLQRVQGAPLTVGQTLFEVAPLSEMVVEVAVPEKEVTYVAAGRRVAVRLNAYPSTILDGVVRRVHPRSEIRNDDSVFVAEVYLDNDSELLRPGMKGQAKIVGARRMLGWILLHDAWYWLAGRLGW